MRSRAEPIIDNATGHRRRRKSCVTGGAEDYKLVAPKAGYDVGCRSAMAEASRYDPKQGIFTLRKVLPEGMVFPHDFGFLPRTLAADGDPIDVLLLMDVPAFPGCLVPSRLIGVIEGEQLDGKKKVRNDRLIAVATLSHAYKNWESSRIYPVNL